MCGNLGDPIVAKDTLQIYEYLREANPTMGLQMHTNGSGRTDKWWKELAKLNVNVVFGIDGLADTHAKYRINTDWKKIIHNVMTFVDAGGEARWDMLVFKHNEHQIEEAKTLAKSYGVDKVAFKTAQIYEYTDGNPLIPSDEKYSRYTKNQQGQYELKYKVTDECWKMWHSCVITWDGQVVPCCFDKDAEHPMGRLDQQNFDEIWHSDAYQKFRESLFHSRSQIEMCKNCSEGSKVWA